VQLTWGFGHAWARCGRPDAELALDAIPPIPFLRVQIKSMEKFFVCLLIFLRVPLPHLSPIIFTANPTFRGMWHNI